MSTKTLIAGLLGGVAYFIMGMLIWGFLLKEPLNECSGCMRADEDMNMALGIVANLLYGIVIAWVLSKFGVNSFGAGLRQGALFMFLLFLALDLGFYVYTTMYTSLSCVFIDIVISTVIGGVVGGVIGWWLGRK